MQDDRTKVTDANFDAIRKELAFVHDQYCPADRGAREPIIWLDESSVETDGRNLYISAECQDCMKGGETSIKENTKYHIQPKIQIRKHRF